MGKPAHHPPVMLVTAIFSRHEEAITWAKEKSKEAWGDILLQSDQLPFENTNYYEPQMGSNLKLQLAAFSKLIDPCSLVDIKLAANELEADYAKCSDHADVRPLNIDPGYLTLGKFVLATTKDNAHRLYLGKGIYGEVTLHFAHREWQHGEWTYPNYREEKYKSFLTQCRNLLLERR
jgi:hypothetical protein